MQLSRTVDGPRPDVPRILDLDLLLPAITAAKWLRLENPPCCILKCAAHGTGYVLSRHSTVAELLRVLSHATCLQEHRGRPTAGYHRDADPSAPRVPAGRPVDIR